jgi:hypothetical protein
VDHLLTSASCLPSCLPDPAQSGNPFFVEEVLRLMDSEGLLGARGPHRQVGAAVEDQIPDNLQACASASTAWRKNATPAVGTGDRPQLFYRVLQAIHKTDGGLDRQLGTRWS